MPTTILLARHGETDWNAERRVQGHTDRPLNSRGREQARALANQLESEHLDAIYSSDLSRAYETARAVADRRGLGVTVVPDLRERNFGTWEGLTDFEIARRFPESRGGPWGDGEGRDEMARRVIGALRRIALGHRGERVLAVSHGGPLRALRAHCGVEAESVIANCHVARLEIERELIRAVD